MAKSYNGQTKLLHALIAYLVLPTYFSLRTCGSAWWRHRWLGIMDFRLDGREFDCRSPQLILDRLSISLSHPGQLSLLPLAEREMNTDQNAVMFCGWSVKA